MTAPLVYRQDQESPSAAFDWRDRDGTLIDFSTGYTFEVKLVNESGTAALTKTTGITGAATSPNVIVAWSSGDLNLTAGTYKLHLTATTGSADRLFAPGAEPTVIILASV